MPSPISQFGYNTNGLEVSFTSLCLNVSVDSTYSWDFGDGNSSSEENPLHEYTTPGFYNVQLTVVNLDSSTSTSLVIINLSGTINPIMFNDIQKMVDLYSPSEIIGTVKNNSQKEFLIAKWQLYLQPLVFDPEVLPENTFLSFSWPPLVNSLIAKLVVIDIIIMESSAFLITASANGSTNASTTTAPANGGIKSIETGPTKVERYENKDSSSESEKLSNLAKTYKALVSPGGVLDQLKDSACQESKRLQIFLPTCGPLTTSNKGFGIVKDLKPPTYNL